MADKAVSLRGEKNVMFTNRQLVALMWPLLLEQMLAITVGLADSLMVATVGDAAISESARPTVMASICSSSSGHISATS